MAPFFYGWGSTASRLQPLQGGSLLFTIQFPEFPGTLSLLRSTTFLKKRESTFTHSVPFEQFLNTTSCTANQLTGF